MLLLAFRMFSMSRLKAPSTSIFGVDVGIIVGQVNLHSDTNLIAKDATDAKTLVNSRAPRPESNGRRPGPGLGQKLVNEV